MQIAGNQFPFRIASIPMMQKMAPVNANDFDLGIFGPPCEVSADATYRPHYDPDVELVREQKRQSERQCAERKSFRDSGQRSGACSEATLPVSSAKCRAAVRLASR